jgi:hypothetical protein
VNLALYSEQFDNAPWMRSGGTVLANQAIAPDGKQTADKFTENTSGAPNSKKAPPPPPTSRPHHKPLQRHGLTMTL